MSYRSGFGLAELIIVVGIIGILAGLILASANQGKQDARDAAIENAVRQMRFQAEIAFDSAGGSFTNWNQHAIVSSEVGLLLEEIDEHYGNASGPPYVAVIRNSQQHNFCVSAPSRARPGSYYCTDSSGEMALTSAECPNYAADGPPLACP